MAGSAQQRLAALGSAVYLHPLIQSVPTERDSQGNMKYELAGSSLDNLKKEFKNVLNNEQQNILIFATCFSKKSEINRVIDACGLYPALFLSSELGQVTGGRNFKLDKQQRSILEAFTKVRHKSSKKIIYSMIYLF